MNKETIPFIFKPGDRAYWLNEKQWVELEENPENPSEYYPLRIKNEELVFTEEGKDVFFSPYFSLLPINPYDPFDPNNPPEFKSDWPFILRGRRLEIGSEILVRPESGGIVQAKIMNLQLSRSGVSVGARHRDGTSSVVWSPGILFPDEVPSKKKVAKWVYLIIGIPGADTVGFTEEMTQEEARRAYGSSIRMIPGTEREVEG